MSDIIYKKEELTDADVIGESATTLTDLIREAACKALQEGIRANSVVIDEHFAKVNGFTFLFGYGFNTLPPMICGLECHIAKGELPEGYIFGVLEAQCTQREAFKQDIAREIFERLYAHRKFDGHTISVWLNDLICIAEEYGVDLKRYETEGETNG